MTAKDKLTALLESSEAELDAAQAELAGLGGEGFAKAQGSEEDLDSDFDALDNAMEASDAEEAADDDEDEDEGDDGLDNDLDGATDEDDEDEDEPFAKADDGLAAVDATDLVQGVLDALTELRGEVAGLRQDNATMAKAMGAQIRGQRVMAKAQAATLGMPVKPKAARVPTKVPEAAPEGAAVDVEQIMAKAIEGVAERKITSQDFGVFKGYASEYGAPMALELMPNFRQFTGS